MQIKTIPVGFLKANCYILVKDDKCLIIDPGDEGNKIIENIGVIKPLAIIVTHKHFDHIGEVDSLKEYYNIPVYDINNLQEKEYILEKFKFEIIYTKGHDDTCITIYFKEDKIMFTGDFLFKDTIGRIDLYGSNEKDMYKSINKIKTYSNDIIIYPGHGTTTNLGYEKTNNIFFR